MKIVIDASSCSYSVKQLYPHLTDENKKRYNVLTILDYVDYLYDMVMPKLKAVTKKDTVVLHPVCSLEKMNSRDKFVRVAECYAQKVHVPIRSACCGMAGDRGFLFPELTASATLAEALEVSRSKYDGYYSSTRTCEMALSLAVRENYESILYLIDETTGTRMFINLLKIQTPVFICIQN